MGQVSYVDLVTELKDLTNESTCWVTDYFRVEWVKPMNAKGYWFDS